MRLKKVRLAGFKSFVDPISIQIPGSLTAIVGPNGCGKSNIIDAVRWVMGEISAKHLRGDTMADVVFTGSNTRKPVSQASVELVFDNSSGRLGGRYASYAEIAVKRQVTRESQSSYFLNSTRCRRRDVTDVFFGTGLGPRSYAIIEQGMISRLIEARPEDLRDFLEEAAGISQYKERRRETENRIQHTRENLERLTDLREELGKRLTHLKRQATMAERYKVLMREERGLRAELLALRWRALDLEAGAKAGAVKAQELALEAAIAEQRRVEAELERRRADQTAASDAFNEVYRQVLEAEAAIARGEETIQNLRRQRDELRDTLGGEERRLAAAREHAGAELRRLAELGEELARLEPQVAALQAASAEARLELRRVEEAMLAWQSDWEAWSEQAAEPARARDAEGARIQQLEQTVAQLERRGLKLREEQTGLASPEHESGARERDRELTAAEQRTTALDESVAQRQREVHAARERERQAASSLHGARERLQELRGRLASLQALQQDALGKTPGAAMQWLRDTGLAEEPRLAEILAVDPGWERAVELVLGFRLEAVCVESLDPYAASLDLVGDGTVMLIERDTSTEAAPRGAATLEGRVRAPGTILALLADVRTAESLEQALALRRTLSPGESVVTRDGVWAGAGWLRVARALGEDAGVLSREQEIKEQAARYEALETEVARREAELQSAHDALTRLEQSLGESQKALADGHHRVAGLKAELATARAVHDQVRARAVTVSAELADIDSQLAAEREVLASARQRLQHSTVQLERLDVEREEWTRRRDEHRHRHEEHQERWQAAREEAYELGLRAESIRAQMQSLSQGRARNEEQVRQLEARIESLGESLSASDSPLADAQRDLEQKLAARGRIDESLREARTRMEDCEIAVRELEASRHAHEERVAEQRTLLESLRLEAQEVRVRRKTVEEQFAGLGARLDDVLEQLPAEATPGAWEEKLSDTERRITRLGPINMSAIEEHEQQAERKAYLDAQHQDLDEALATLTAAIQKIDRETRARFKETYEKVNAGVGAMFPRLFGGGHAYLQLTGDDLLSTGVSVMARPPGKRNTSIHLLSGGEKALTAIALVFAIFELNPAPFCLLDEVDAPLDDVNVVRFCDLVKDMSERVQFIVVTHNKITMEIAEQLIGVTMNEPGVSRLVAVDVDEAVELVAV